MLYLQPLPPQETSYLPATLLHHVQELTFLEFFAGQGNVWKLMRADSKNAVGVDLDYGQGTDQGQNPMDILTCAGLGFHA